VWSEWQELSLRPLLPHEVSGNPCIGLKSHVASKCIGKFQRGGVAELVEIESDVVSGIATQTIRR
jgi:hypothetical protein